MSALPTIDEHPAIPKELQSEEILLKSNPERFVLFPIKYDEIWNRYKTALAGFWVAEDEAQDLHADVKEFTLMKPEEQNFIQHTLVLLATNHEILLEQLITEVQIPEVRCFWGFQLSMKNIHRETQWMFIDGFIKDYSNEISKRSQIMRTLPSQRLKSKWLAKWIEDKKNKSFAERLVALAIEEGLFLSGLFCGIFAVTRRQHLLRNLSYVYDLMWRDKTQYCNFACLLYSMLLYRLTQEKVESIIREAVVIEQVSVIEANTGLDTKLMNQFIEHVADRLLVGLGHSKIYNATNPFNWMATITLSTQCFAKDIADRLRATTTKSTIEIGKNNFTLDAEF